MSGEEAVRAFDLGSTLRRSGRPGEALAPLEKALEIFETLGEARPWAAVENEIGCALRDLGRPMEATQRFSNAIQTLRQGEPTSASQQALMLALANLGRALRELDRYEEALLALHEAHGLAHAPERRREEPHVLNAIGSVYRDLHLTKEAEELYTQALHASRKEEDEAGEAQAANNLGVIAIDTERPNDAVRWFSTALEHYQRLEDVRRQALTRSNLGRALADLGDVDTAIKQLEAAAHELTELGASAEAAAALASLGGAYGKAQRYEAAADAYARARELFADVGNLVGQATMDGSIAGMLINQDRDAEGLALLRRAIDTLERSYDTVRSDELRAQLVASTSRLHVLHARLLAGEERPVDVLEAVELGRARALRLAAARTSDQGSTPDARDELNRELMLIERQLAEVRDPPAASAPYDALRSRQRELRLRLRAIDGLRDTLDAEPGALAMDDVRRALAETNEVLLHYTLSRDTAFVVAMHDGAAKLHEIEGAEKLPRLVADLRTGIARRARALPQVFELYDALIAPVAALLQGRDVLVVPDGPLFEVPWAMLRPRPAGAHRPAALVRDHAIRLAPSVAWAFASAPVRPEQRQERRDLLALAVPLTPARRERAAREAPLDAERIALRSGALGELPGATREVERIAEVCGGPERVSVRIGEAATKRALEGLLFADGARYRWVHLACHGLLDRDRPEYSGLLLHPDGRGDPCLRAFEIAARRVDCELVVLSACNTGAGRYLAGEGLMGIARAFLAAGAPSVCVSTWPVADVSTPELMCAFYEQLNQGAPPARALAIAQRAQLEGKFADPFFWAPFTVVGRSS